jgi:hypothetical protein
MAKKLQPINYTSRDFDSIRADLEEYAKRYYSETYKDFTQAGFGSLMLDTVSYIGDILSFYLDYQANESFLDTAMEYTNVVRLAREMGFKLNPNASSYGLVTFYIKVPASSTSLGPDYNYAPVLKAGSELSALGGGFYSLIDDVDFSATTNPVVVGAVNNTTGNPINYVIRSQGRVISGRMTTETFEIGAFERFRKLNLGTSIINNVVRVVDSEGHEYYEVENLSQNIIFKALRNTSTTRASVPNILKATPVARRFTTEYDGNRTTLQFGYGSDSELLSEAVVDPTNLMLDLNGRTYVTETNFDPTKLISSDKFGIAPANTTLTISYRYNTVADVNAAVGAINQITAPHLRFNNQAQLNVGKRTDVRASLEAFNEEPLVGSVELPSSAEVKERVFGYFAAQNRAVTVEDYRAIIYGMPAKFGAVKRVAIERDFDSFRRNLNAYVISEDTSGKLLAANSTLKNNVKSWINHYKMINDTVDLLDAQIVNFGVEYSIVNDYSTSRFTTISKCNSALVKYFLQGYDIGEAINISDIYKTLNRVPGVVDVVDVRLKLKSGGSYSESNYDFDSHLSVDGRQLAADVGVIFEIKFPNNDIKGSIK